MKLRDLLNKKVELNSFLDSSPFGWMGSLYDRIFGKKMTAAETREWWDQNKPKSYRTGPTPPPPVAKLGSSIKTFRIDKDISSFTKIYGQSADVGISVQLIKKAMINDLIEKVAESGEIEFKQWNQVNQFGADEQFISAEIKLVCKNN